MLDKKKAPSAAGNSEKGHTQNVSTDSIAESGNLVNPSAKARYWACVMYPENMCADWELKIGDLLQGLPYGYAIHYASKDTKSEHRKDHTHVLLVFPNTTTYKHAMEVFGALNAPGKKAFNTCQQVHNIRGAYDYLIHDTEACRKQGKELYDKSARITGNNFDIGAYEQIGVTEKRNAIKELAAIIIERRFTNFTDFYTYVVLAYADEAVYQDVLLTNSGFFERLTKGNFQKWQTQQELDKQRRN